MTQRVSSYFGVSVSVKNESDPKTFAKMQSLLKQQLSSQGLSIPVGAKIYIKHLTIEAAETHFTVAGFQNRISRLGVVASIGQRAMLRGAIRLVDIGCSCDEAVQVDRSSSRVQYLLPASYIAKHRQYVDYVAVVVDQGCLERDKKLLVRIHAHATPEFGRRLKNVPDGSVRTGLRFHLTRDVQLTLW